MTIFLMAKKKNKNSFWKHLHFKYRLSIVNENTLEEIWKIRASIFSGAILLLIFATFLVAITSFIIIATPIRYYLPGYLDSEVREKALRSAIKADSLEQQLKFQEVYINNIRDIFTGARQTDSVKYIDTVSVSADDPLLLKTETEKDYNKRFEEEEKYNLSVLSQTTTIPMEGVVFFKPVKGLITEKFNPSDGQYGININISGKETVSAVLEGTVIFSGYDMQSGHTIQIQHKNGFISIYKNSTLLLKEMGTKVSTGEAIAIIENKKAEKDDKNPSTVFGFELWYKGKALDPESYILF